jgi:hypothetical protein
MSYAAGPAQIAVPFREWAGFIPRFRLLPAGTAHDSIHDALAASPTVTLNFEALNIFLHTGGFLNGQTPFEQVQLIQPEPIIFPPRECNREQALDDYIGLFRDAVARTAAGVPTAMGLSGGCDSRHILLELHHQRRLPEYAFTFWYPTRPEETAIAAEVARRTGVRHIVSEPNPDAYATDESEKNHATHYRSRIHGWMMSIARRPDMLAWWDGIGGDVLSAGLFLEPWNLELYRKGRLDELADRLTAPTPHFQFIDRRHLSRDAAVHALRQELRKHVDAANPIGSFFFWNRTRNLIAPGTFYLTCPRGQTVLTPYLDWDVVRYLSGIPAELLLDHQFHVDAVRRAYPDFADIPYFKAQVEMPPAFSRRVWRSLIRHLLKHFTLAPLPAATALAQALRALLIPSHLSDWMWLGPNIVYSLDLLGALQRHQRRGA